jgi:hypothetical protein
MASHISASGKVWHDPVRSESGGERIRLWLDADLQAGLRQLAAQQDTTITHAARLALRQWLAERTNG